MPTLSSPLYDQLTRHKKWIFLSLGHQTAKVLKTNLDQALLEKNLVIRSDRIQWQNPGIEDCVVFLSYQDHQAQSETPDSVERIFDISSAAFKTTFLHFTELNQTMKRRPTSVRLGLNSQVDWIDMVVGEMSDNHQDISYDQIFLLQEKSSLRKWTLDLSTGTQSQISEKVILLGQEAMVDNQWVLSSRHNSKLNHQLEVIHKSPKTYSRVSCRAIADKNSKCFLKAGITIPRDSQQVDSGMMLKSLLIEKGAMVQLQPELLIDANDVKAAHGATVGFLNQEEMFYLQSRGLHPQQAKTILTKAFLMDVLTSVDHDVQKIIAEKIESLS